MNDNKKTPDKFPRTVVLPDGTVFKAYGVTTIKAPHPFAATTTHRPAMPVDWAFWPASRRVTCDEAIALSLGLDPHSLYSNIDGRINPEFCPDNATAILFLKRLILLTACNSKTNIPLSEIAAWAVSINLSPIPPELETIAREHGESVSAPAPLDNVAVTPAKVDAGDTVTEAAQAAPVDDANWITQARAIAKEYLERHVEQDLFPSQDDVCKYLETVLRKREIYGVHRKPLDSSYIQRNAIQGKWWKENSKR